MAEIDTPLLVVMACQTGASISAVTVPGGIDTAVTKVMMKAREELSKLFAFTLKEKGVILDSTRDLINDLVALDGVRLNKVVVVLKHVVGKLGIEVTGNTSDCSVCRIVKEGGATATMQFVEAVGTSKGACNFVCFK
jgi:hypothetical protein